MTYRSLVIDNDTTTEQILQQIDRTITIVSSVNPVGNVAADRVSQLCVDTTTHNIYYCLATDGTILGTSWQLISLLQAASLNLGNAATKDLGTTSTTVAVGNHTHTLESLGILGTGVGATGAPGNPVFWENDKAVTGSYTISSGKNAMSAGPITINDSVTVTIPSDSVWTIV